jgi:peptidoglycan/LPS O-acetylase OafA/YrhL
VSRDAPTSDAVSHGRRDLPSLTGLRFVAALMVFAFHSSGYGVLASPIWHSTQFGFIGVTFFFVLSGVVLTWSARPGQTAGKFWRRRFARIYPSHAAVALVAIGLYLFVMPPHKPLWAGLVALVLLQAWSWNPVVFSAGNGVSWSLSCEAFFYALFPWLMPLLGRRRRRVVVVGVLLTACSTAAVVFSFVLGGRYDVPAYMNPMVRVGEFALGVALGHALREGWVPRIRVATAWSATAAAAGVALLLGMMRGWPVPRGAADVLALGPFALVLMAYAGKDLTGRGSWLSRPWAVYLGQLSFAFYLVHQLVMDFVLQRLVPMPTATVPAALGRTAICLVLAVLAAMAVHHGIELPGQRLLSRRRRATWPSTVVVPYPDEARVSTARWVA